MTTQIQTAPNGEHETKSSELAPRLPIPAQSSDEGEFANLLDSSRFAHLQRVAHLFASSELVPEAFRGKVANCFIGLQMALRMRVDPFAFLQSCYIVHGRPGIEAKLAIALVNSSGLFTDSLEYEVEGDDPMAPAYRVRAKATRRSTNKTIFGPWIDWTLVRAEGWESKSGSKWKTMPGIMFQYRAAMFFARLHCPERLLGMQTVDELEDVGPRHQVHSQVLANDAAPVPRTKAQRVALQLASTLSPKDSPTRPEPPSASAQPTRDAETSPAPIPQEAAGADGEESQIGGADAAPDVEEPTADDTELPQTYEELENWIGTLCVHAGKMNPTEFAKSMVLTAFKKARQKNDKLTHATVSPNWLADQWRAAEKGQGFYIALAPVAETT